MNLNELAQRAHQNAVKHGFWENELSVEHCLMLIITEIAEAVEADRKNKRASVKVYITEMETTLTEYKLNGGDAETEEDFEVVKQRFCYNNFIKGSVEEELADAVIRLLDLAGQYNLNLRFHADIIPSVQETFMEKCFYICNGITSQAGRSMDEDISLHISLIFDLANMYNIDLEWHIEQKMRYNESRPYKHGKEY
jgi:NTP pyrophosphatase (non-canonical NTP hydrolase)